MDGTPSDASSPEGVCHARPPPRAARCRTLPSRGRSPSLSFYRDLHKFYAAKDKLFPERTSGLIFFENMMGIFFTGRDLTDEVLAETTPEVRFVVAEQQYDAEGGHAAGPTAGLRRRVPHEEPGKVRAGRRRGISESAWAWSTSPAGRRPSRA